ncbi:Cob(I)alamin adenosyltransferase [hydrothermal vent metagenome]|uniref:Cob(I)alamin adenosyltransferase n=1 Tax=hydrothermal vent metagenome TaxID=652676 RepID=A0A3B1CWG9_9ZZZZ
MDKAPRKHKIVKESVKKGLIIVHTGAGKGKSTAAFGTAVRAMGHGYKVAIVQFIKGKWKTGEGKFFKEFPKLCDMFSLGDGFTWDTKNPEQDIKTAQKTWEKCCEVLHDEQYQLVIFDELNYALKFNFLEVEVVLDVLEKKPAMKHVILTGNGAPDALIEKADLVTEMKCTKHPYEQGVKAQMGIDF